MIKNMQKYEQKKIAYSVIIVPPRAELYRLQNGETYCQWNH